MVNIYIIYNIYINIYIYEYISEVGGLRPNREIVSFRSCVRAQLYVRSEWISKMIADPFSLFPFAHEITSLSSWEIRCSLSLDIDEIKGVQVRSSESK